MRKWEKTQAEEKEFAKKHGLPWTDHGFVFTTENGSPLGNNMGRLWTRIMREADKDGDLGEWGPAPKRKGKHGPKPERPFTPNFSMYVLRHTRLTLMYEDTKDIVAVSRFARHKNVGITTRFYVHTKAEHTKEAAAESFKRLMASVS